MNKKYKDKLETMLSYSFYPYSHKKHKLHSNRYKEECVYITNVINDKESFYKFLMGWNFEIDKNFILSSYQLVPNAESYDPNELRKIVVNRLHESIVKQANESDFLDYVGLDYEVVKNVGVKIKLTPISLIPYQYYLKIIRKSKWISSGILLLIFSLITLIII